MFIPCTYKIIIIYILTLNKSFRGVVFDPLRICQERELSPTRFRHKKQHGTLNQNAYHK